VRVFIADNVYVDMFTVLTEFDKIANELERAAEKFRTADAFYRNKDAQLYSIIYLITTIVG